MTPDPSPARQLTTAAPADLFDIVAGARRRFGSSVRITAESRPPQAFDLTIRSPGRAGGREPRGPADGSAEEHVQAAEIRDRQRETFNCWCSFLSDPEHHREVFWRAMKVVTDGEEELERESFRSASRVWQLPDSVRKALGDTSDPLTRAYGLHLGAFEPLLRRVRVPYLMRPEESVSTVESLVRHLGHRDVDWWLLDLPGAGVLVTLCLVEGTTQHAWMSDYGEAGWVRHDTVEGRTVWSRLATP